MTVSELNLKAKSLLEAHFDDIVLSGEIAKITLHSSSVQEGNAEKLPHAEW